jgi:hypothetical protein
MTSGTSNPATFVLDAPEVAPGTKHPNVKAAQSFLREFGYLTESASTDGTFDAPTIEALTRYQQFRRVAPSGRLTSDVLTLMSGLRCGNPDLHPFGTLSRFVTSGCSWWAQLRTITFGFQNVTTDIAGDGERDAVRRAFQTWSAQAGVDFVEVPIENNPVFRVGWHARDHGDGVVFDGPGHTLAHAFYPPPCGGALAGHCHFDEDETWSNTAGAGVDLESVALHEIGHLLGLDHSQEAGAVMNAEFNVGTQKRALTQDDILGIRSLYGPPGPALRCKAHLEAEGTVVGRDNQFLGSRGQSRRCEGFAVEIASPIAGLTVEYMAHVEGWGDTSWVGEGTFIGSQGQNRRMEGFALRLAGPAGGNYSVAYMAHLQGIGDTPLARDGEFCGTRGQSRRVEGMLVRIEPRS